MTRSHRALLTIFATPLACLTAQADPGTPDRDTPTGNLTPATAIAPSLVPLHGAPAGQADDGLWAGGPDYKASFHDGFTFYPYIPGQQRSCAMQWHTEALRIGEQELSLAAPTIVHDDFHCEFRREGLLESYDLGERGIEQTFVVAQRPATPGAITVVARIDTPFVAAMQPAKVGELHFATADGKDALVYGKASVVDHAGRHADVGTSFDGKHITLTVDAAFVAAAEFPITIDPLTAAVTYGTFSEVITATAITAGSVAGNHAVLSCIVRQFSATDRDVSAYLLSDTQSGAGTLVYVNNSTVDMDQIDCGEVDGTQNWVLAVRSNITTPAVFLYQHLETSTGLNSGTVITLPAPLANQIDARVGGGGNGCTRALIVWRDVSIGSLLKAAVLDTVTHAITPFALNAVALLVPNGGLAVTKAAQGVEPWRVLWSSGASSYSLHAAVVDQGGLVSHLTPVGPTYPLAEVVHDVRIAGSAGRYLATYVTDTSGTNGVLHTLRFDFSQLGVLGNLHDRVLATAATFPIQTLTNGDLAYDLVTQSHWAVTWRSTQLLLTPPSNTYANIVRLGHSGGVVASASLHAVNNEGVAHPTVAFDGYPVVGSAEGFVVNYSTAVATNPVFFRRFTYTPPTGAFYGVSCRNNTIGDGHPPYAGSEFYYDAVLGLAPGTPALELVGLAPLNVSLTPFGFTGCNLLVDQIGTIGAVADASGNAFATLSLPDDPAYFGNVYIQWAWIEIGANPIGVVLSGGLQFQPQ